MNSFIYYVSFEEECRIGSVNLFWYLYVVGSCITRIVVICYWSGCNYLICKCGMVYNRKLASTYCSIDHNGLMVTMKLNPRWITFVVPASFCRFPCLSAWAGWSQDPFLLCSPRNGWPASSAPRSTPSAHPCCSYPLPCNNCSPRLVRAPAPLDYPRLCLARICTVACFRPAGLAVTLVWKFGIRSLRFGGCGCAVAAGSLRQMRICWGIRVFCPFSL